METVQLFGSIQALRDQRNQPNIYNGKNYRKSIDAMVLS